MHHIILNEPKEKYSIAVLLKTNALTQYGLEHYYVHPLESLGIPKDSCIGLSLEYFNKKKPTAKEIKEYLIEDLLPTCKELGVKVLYCTDGNYMKVLTKKTKVEPLYGYVVPCALEGFTDMQVVYSANHMALFVNDTLQAKIDLANETTANYLEGSYQEIGTNIIKYEEYIPCQVKLVKEALERLHQYDSLTCDTETFSLRHSKAGLGTIGFAWSKHEGLCIDVEHLARTSCTGIRSTQMAVRALLREFFETYKGKLIFHNASYDIKILIYYLWMKDLLDTDGLLKGLAVLTRNFEDTKIIAYLATNSCSGNKLSLKDLAHEFAGNYAQSEINDITKIKNQDLMKYNLVDCLATWFVYEKYTPIMIQDEQEEVYAFFKKALINIIQMELTGMPIDMERTIEVDNQLKDIVDGYWDVLNNSPLLADFISKRKQAILIEKNAAYKKKVITIDEVKYEFNPNSNQELIRLIHEYLEYPVYALTDTKQPAVGGKEVKGHMKRSTDEEAKRVLEAILKIQEGDKIRNTFISKFLDADKGPDGWNYLFGSFNLGGTKSGRLSSSNPNMQNLPSGSTYGKLVKSCFRAPPGVVTLHFENLKGKEISETNLDILFKIRSLAIGKEIKANNRKRFDELYAQLEDKEFFKTHHIFDIDVGWLFYGIDYASLEDRINTLLTKDPNKLKVYTDGFDGHSYRAVSYWPDKFTHVDISNPDSVNSITDTDEGDKLRGKSKAPTFALTYAGTWNTLVTSCRFTEEEAKEIERRYHELYTVSDAWVRTKIDEATMKGYVTLAFGLRLRTPILRKTILGAKCTPHQAAAESRTAGNAVSGQSYGLLNSRAGSEFQERVINSEFREDIKPSAHIHDAQYGMVRNTPEAVKWLNDNIVECVEWQDLPEIAHDEVKLTGDLGIFYPAWHNEITLPHNVSEKELMEVCKQGVEKYNSK